jgi:hypothetical protein
MNYRVGTYGDFEDFTAAVARMPWFVFSTCAGGGPGAFCPGICAMSIGAAAKKRNRMGIAVRLERKISAFRSILNLDFLFASILTRG